MNVFDRTTMIRYRFREVYCPRCGMVFESLDQATLGLRMTKCLVRYILDLCKVMTIQEIADHLGLDWKTVKEIHQEALTKKYSDKNIGYPVLLAIDEMAIKKRHHYLTIIINWVTGAVLFVAKGRRSDTMKGFFATLTDKQQSKIQAVAIDMWDPYIKVGIETYPHATIVFDQFHAVSSFDRITDRVCTNAYKEESRKENEIIKGSKYMLLKNRDNRREETQPHMKRRWRCSDSQSYKNALG